jgi:hypothetical protein
MAIDIRIIKKFCPSLVLDSKENEKPINVEKSLDTASLKKENGFETLIEKIDLADSTILQSFKNFCDTEDGLYVDWKLLNKTADIEETLLPQALKDLLKQSSDYPGYYTVVESLSGVTNVEPGFKQVMNGHYILNYAFYFPSMNGYPYEAAPTTNEGRWASFSLLVDKDSHDPVYAGFHGTNGVRILGVADNDLTGKDSTFDCYVSLGCHSFFEAAGSYEFRYNSGVPNIPAAMQSESSGLEPSGTICTIDEFGIERCQPMSEGDAVWAWILGLVLIFVALTDLLDDSDEPAPQENTNDDPNSNLSVEPMAFEDDEENVEIDMTDITLYETNDGKGTVIKPKLIATETVSWWKYDHLKWGDQDVTAVGLERFGAGIKRPDFVGAFLSRLASRID